MEDDQNGRRPKWKTTKMEDNFVYEPFGNGCDTGAIWLVLRKDSFNAFAISLGDVKTLPLNLIILGVLLNDLFDVFR